MIDIIPKHFVLPQVFCANNSGLCSHLFPLLPGVVLTSQFFLGLRPLSPQGTREGIISVLKKSLLLCKLCRLAHWGLQSPMDCPAWRFCFGQQFVPYQSPSWILQGLKIGWAVLQEHIPKLLCAGGEKLQYWVFIIFLWVTNITHWLEETQLFICASQPVHAAHKCAQACV